MASLSGLCFLSLAFNYMIWKSMDGATLEDLEVSNHCQLFSEEIELCSNQDVQVFTSCFSRYKLFAGYAQYLF